MGVWLVTCIVLFILVQLYQWVIGFILPLPIYILAGAFLAIASNSERGIGSLFGRSSQKTVTLSQNATLVNSTHSLEGEKIAVAALESERTFTQE
ncbi:hypothetical protein [Gloeothece verrucosa]|uniref:Uncharacterized protein n=1 Tax=Gloeothece verrucosa (strain PCC 7822) TaxID=497965 RepID=E0U683_GLOV7|nr:hypothetical protein [Gloeothece verrucosa]ADN12419.1 hypothetical protein Cyan7822_0373 [Gloeothece verrucosa PCC 7822]